MSCIGGRLHSYIFVFLVFVSALLLSPFQHDDNNHEFVRLIGILRFGVEFLEYNVFLIEAAHNLCPYFALFQAEPETKALGCADRIPMLIGPIALT